MKFSLVQSELYRSLQLVAGVVPGKTTAHHLTSVLLEATADGQLSFTGTDLDTFLVTRMHANVEEPGRAAVPARRFLEIVKELPSDIVEIGTFASGLSISCAKGRFRLVGPDAQEFPKVPELSEEKIFAVSADTLDRLIRQTIYAVSTDFTRPEQTAVYVHVIDGTLRFVATNGHRLAMASHRGDYPSWQDILVPPKALAVLQRLLPEAQESVSMTASKKYCLFNLGANRLFTRLLDGPFPPYDQAIPSNCDKTARLDRDAIISAFRRIAVFSETATKMVKLTLREGTLSLSSQTHDVGQAEEPVPAEYSGPELSIGFNAAYILDLLRTMDSEQVDIAFRTPTTAGVFTPRVPDGKPDLLCLVMPLRLPEESPSKEKAESAAE